MANSDHSSLESEDLSNSQKRGKRLEEITRNCQTIEGPGFLTRYKLELRNTTDTRFIRYTTGEKDPSKPHKTILLVGETGTGKSAIINCMVNYMLGVNFNDNIWCEIIETKGNQKHSQTKCVTVYDIFIEKSSFSLTVIDTPGFGSTRGPQEDVKVAETLHELCRSKDGVQEINLVCLVVSAANARLTQTQLYVFDAVLSLFGKDVENNIVVLITRAPRKPINAINAIKESQVTCAKTANGEPVYFRFDNSHCEAINEKYTNDAEYNEEHKASWKMFQKSMRDIFYFLDKAQTTSLKLTEIVLRNRKQLTACINNIKDKIIETKQKKTELEQTKAALEEHKKKKQTSNNFEYEVDESYKEKVPIESAWWWWSKEATCCSVCEENCHYPGCWWVRDLSRCSVMKDGKCTVCTGRCDHTHHVKEGKMYVVKTRKVKRTYEDLIGKYEKVYGENMDMMKCLKNEIKEQENEKIRLVEECYQCVVTLEDIALKTDSVFTLQHLDFLIEKVKEVKQPERVKKLEDLKKKAESVNKGPVKFLK